MEEKLCHPETIIQLGGSAKICITCIRRNILIESIQTAVKVPRRCCSLRVWKPTPLWGLMTAEVPSDPGNRQSVSLQNHTYVGLKWLCLKALSGWAPHKDPCLWAPLPPPIGVTWWSKGLPCTASHGSCSRDSKVRCKKFPKCKDSARYFFRCV